MNKVNSKIRKVVRTILLMIVLIGYQQEVHAQWSFDVPSIEAYINDHKKQRSLLLAKMIRLNTATSCCTNTVARKP